MNFPQYNMNVQVGSTMMNLFGTYEVLTIDERKGSMSVRYLDGKKARYIQELDIRGQVKSMWREKVRADAQMKISRITFTGTNEFFTLGFLARNCFVCVRIKEASQKQFEQTYFNLTGLQPWTPGVAGHYYDLSHDDESGSNDYYHVGFPTPPDEIKQLLSFSKKDEVHWDVFGSVSKYNSMNYVLNMLSLGFRLGKAHDLDLIRRNINSSESFEQGFAIKID